MDLGGPVWHASVKSLRPTTTTELRRMTNAVLDGVGDNRRGQWWERIDAMHQRRRLTVDEEAIVGPVVDIRRTTEAWVRAQPLAQLGLLAHVPTHVLGDEVADIVIID
jgi:hypothetical protein